MQNPQRTPLRSYVTLFFLFVTFSAHGAGVHETKSYDISGQNSSEIRSQNNKTEEKKGKSVARAEEKIREKSRSLDKNGNGIFDREEIDAKKAKLGMLADFAERALDENRDGVITSQEYINVQVNEVRKSDTNKDGYIDEKEEKEQKKQIIKRALGL